MLGGGAEISVGFLKQLQSVLNRHLHNDQTDRREENHLNVERTETKLYSGWSWSHGWGELYFSTITFEVDLL